MSDVSFKIHGQTHLNIYGDFLLTLNLDTDGLLEYNRATRETIRSYPFSLGIMPIHQFRRKPNKYEKTPIIGI
ncbi:hypothetical protein Hanom_Chr05g00451091 [Helianthus anomalus]